VNSRVAYNIAYRYRYNYDLDQSGIVQPVSLVANGLTEMTVAAIDTGSSLCVFQREIADSLGIPVVDGILDYVSAMGTMIRVYGHEVTLGLGDLSVELFVYFPEYQRIPRNLLGRQGFLQRVLFGLDDYEGVVYFGYHSDQ
jgi:hypothetical protein